jgi:hypothetical protein
MKEAVKNKNLSAGKAFIDAMVQYNASGYHRHRLRDIRIEGAFVEMGNVRVLSKDALVRIVFVHRELGRSLTHLLKATVAKVETNGAFLKFVDVDDQAQHALSSLQG